MIACQLDSKTKQLAVAQSGFGVLYSPFLALGMAFLPGFRSSACPVWGGRSWLQTPSNGSVIRLGQGLLAGVELVTFVVSITLPIPSSPSLGGHSARKFFLLLLYFQLLVKFYRTLGPFWSDKCFVGSWPPLCLSAGGPV